MTMTSKPRCYGILASLLAVHTLLLGYNAMWMSPTLDEPAHLVAGLSHWRFGEFSLYRVNPPLVRMVAVIPVMLSGYQFEFPDLARVGAGRPEFTLGEEFVHENGRRTLWLTTLARWACIPFSWLGALLCYRWATQLYGVPAGLLACSLWCFSPMVLGHASLLTPDAHAAALGLLACYTFWRWLKSPTWSGAMSTGLILGLAELAKSTLILLYPIWPLLWLGYRLSERRTMSWKRWRDEGAMLAFRMLIGLYVINLGYLGSGSFIQLKEYSFVSALFGGDRYGNVLDSKSANRFRGTWLQHVPVPLPYDYVMGVDTQQRDFEDFGRPSYMRGNFQDKGWWYYYAYAALVKTPLGTWGLLFMSVYLSLIQSARASHWRDELILLAPAAIIFVTVSSKTGFSHHYRYVFPCLPLVMIWISQVAACFRGLSVAEENVPNARIGSSGIRSNWFLRLLVTICVTGSFGSSLWCYPHSLAYFNEASGGPVHGPEHLINSNIDWGQDLLHLESWIQAQAGQLPVYLAFDNYLNPFDLNITRIEPWPLRRPAEIPGEFDDVAMTTAASVEEGYYAISVNQLYEFPWPLRAPDGARYSIDTRPLKALRGMPPIGWGGYSIRIYSAVQLRAAYVALADE